MVVATIVIYLIVIVMVTFEVATRSNTKLVTKLDIMQAPLTMHDHLIMGTRCVKKKNYKTKPNRKQQFMN